MRQELRREIGATPGPTYSVDFCAPDRIFSTAMYIFPADSFSAGGRLRHDQSPE
jgi:hypothetical protein